MQAAAMSCSAVAAESFRAESGTVLQNTVQMTQDAATRYDEKVDLGAPADPLSRAVSWKRPGRR